ncbi:flavin-containing monooxygenase [Paenibacillus sp. 481]|uniref:flavin-containing monooxygenase n=1 Tax=Paenibacillus sp. 481 TaxID=2835869 RepID=UPI001E2A7907|nr:NAD(P)-binding domain-containing protein [Paenibacillus sp. 481]UHA71852.1 NAD(P)-binding domain-containing protein [Paenibacillus sp. 481]
MNTDQTLDVIIIGGGQAGLSLGWHLRSLQPQLTFLIVERHHRIGDNWRERYDSLVLFTPRTYSQLPGVSMDGDPTGFPTKDEVAQYLEDYARQAQLPVLTSSEVVQVTWEAQKNHFKVAIRQSPNLHSIQHDHHSQLEQHISLYCKQLVLASGPFQTPYIPAWAANIDTNVIQLHSSQYRSPTQLPTLSTQHNVLVVGGGNSGAQIAVELARTSHVSLSVRHPLRHMKLSLLGRSTFEWMDKLGLLHAPSHSRRAKLIRRLGDPVFGNELAAALRTGQITMQPAATSWDSASASICFQDGSTFAPNAIIWATGFNNDNRWLHLPGLLNERGQIIYFGHSTPVPGLYVIGMPWQRSRSSALLCGAGRDAYPLAQEVIHFAQT